LERRRSTCTLSVDVTYPSGFGRARHDLCFLTNSPMSNVVACVQVEAIVILGGRVANVGAERPIRSVYFRMPRETSWKSPCR